MHKETTLAKSQCMGGYMSAHGAKNAKFEHTEG